MSYEPSYFEINLALRAFYNDELPGDWSEEQEESMRQALIAAEAVR